MISQVIKRLQEDPNPPHGYTWLQDTLRYKGHLFLVQNSYLKQRVLTTMHSSPLPGHSGFQKNYAYTRHSFFLEGMKKDILTFAAECDTFQWNKGETVKDPRPLKPLPIPPTLWIDISMDFIMGLQKYGNKSVIKVVVGRLSKYDHFCALQHLFIVSYVAQIFLDQILKLHGMTASIVSNCDPTFTSKFQQ